MAALSFKVYRRGTWKCKTQRAECMYEKYGEHMQNNCVARWKKSGQTLWLWHLDH